MRWSYQMPTCRKNAASRASESIVVGCFGSGTTGASITFLGGDVIGVDNVSLPGALPEVAPSSEGCEFASNIE